MHQMRKLYFSTFSYITVCCCNQLSVFSVVYLENAFCIKEIICQKPCQELYCFEIIGCTKVRWTKCTKKNYFYKFLCFYIFLQYYASYPDNIFEEVHDSDMQQYRSFEYVNLWATRIQRFIKFAHSGYLISMWDN